MTTPGTARQLKAGVLRGLCGGAHAGVHRSGSPPGESCTSLTPTPNGRPRQAASRTPGRVPDHRTSVRTTWHGPQRGCRRRFWPDASVSHRRVWLAMADPAGCRLLSGGGAAMSEGGHRTPSRPGRYRPVVTIRRSPGSRLVRVRFGALAGHLRQQRRYFSLGLDELVGGVELVPQPGDLSPETGHLCPGGVLGFPPALVSVKPLSAPASRCLRHSVINDEYRSSRRRISPTAPGSPVSFA